jgi:OOP family OmpA-OmpF porin
MFCFEAKTQTNLVYNGDFELYSSCPLTESGGTQPIKEVTKCSGWDIATWGTSDYFNSCSNNFTYQPVGVPKNLVGYQNAYSGEGYTGGFFYLMGYTTNGHYREYIQGSLINTLQTGKKYNFSLQLSLANSSALSIKYIGIVFSNSKIQQLNTWKPLTNTPDISFTSPTFYNDSLNWVMLSGSYIANGTENYLTIGNFTDSLGTDTFRLLPFDSDAPDFSSYYYIDDVKLYEFDSVITTQVCSDYLPNVFTPNADSINDILKFTICTKIIKTTIYNRWGNLVFETDKQNRSWDGRTTSGEPCVEGNYFYIIETEDKNT